MALPFGTDPVLTIADVAEEIGQHYQTVRKHIQSGDLKAVKRGNRWFIRSWLDQFLEPSDPQGADTARTPPS